MEDEDEDRPNAHENSRRIIEQASQFLDQNEELDLLLSQAQAQRQRLALNSQTSTTTSSTFTVPRACGVFPTAESQLSNTLSSRSRRLSEALRPPSDLASEAPQSTTDSHCSDSTPLSTDDDPGSAIDRCWPWPSDRSLNLFGPENRFRLFGRTLIQNTWFCFAIHVVIIVSFLCLALEKPYLENSSTGQQWVPYLEYLFVVVFTTEFLIRVLVAGLIFRPTSRARLIEFGEPYTRVGMNWIDLISLLAAWTPVFLGDNDQLSGLRALRGLRTLRTLTSFVKVREILVGMLVSLPLLGTLVLQTVLVFFIFSIVGMNAFGGLLHLRCTDGIEHGPLCGRLECSELTPLDSLLDECSPEDATGSVFPNPNFGFTGFDNILMAAQTVFTASTLEGWSVTMYQVMDVSSIWSVIYFVALVFLGAFILANLVVAVIVESFQSVHETFTVYDESTNTRPAWLVRLRKACKDFYNWFGMKLTFLQSSRAVTRLIVDNYWFDSFVVVIILANTVVLALEHDGMSEQLTRDLDICNKVFTVFFVLEMVLKMFAYGFRNYFGDGWNVLDFVVGVESVLELILPSSLPAFAIFRALRILRVIRLLKSTTALRLLSTKIAKSSTSVATFIPLFTLFICIFGVIGMHLLGGSFSQEDGNPCTSLSLPDETCPRSRWGSITDSLLAVFQIITGENWIDIMYDAMKFYHPWVAVFFILMFVTLNYFLLNIFLATIVVDFSDVTNLDINAQRELETQQNNSGIPADLSIDAEFEPPPATTDAWAPGTVEESGEENEEQPSPASLFCIPASNPFRQVCVKVTGSAMFELLVICTTLMASISLACWSPAASETRLKILEVIDLIGLGIFISEACLKIIAFGFWAAEDCYIRDGWNIVDFIVVITGILDLALSGTGVGIFRSFRALRAIRPLRLIRQFPGLRLVTTSLTMAIVPSLSVLLLGMIVWFIFAILGVQLWAGGFYYCDCTGVLGCEVNLLANCNAAVECQAMGGNWINFPSNFDNAGNALLTLFEVATLENWLPIMYAAMDTNGKDCQPSFKANPSAAVYFVSFIAVGSFYVLNLFVSVLIDTVAYIKKTHDGTAFMSAEQLEWVEGQRIITRMNIRRVNLPPQAAGVLSGLRQGSFRLVVSQHFEVCVLVLVSCSTIIMAAEYWQMSPGWEIFHLSVSGVFALVFVLEIAVKVLGLGTKQYFRDGWNLFDFAATTTTLAGFLLELIARVSDWNLPVNLGVIRLFRVLRLLRILRLVKRLRLLKLLFETLLLSFHAIINVGSVLFLLFFIYAIAGVELFGRISFETRSESIDNAADLSAYAAGLHRYSNFSNFGWAFLTLLRCVTGESWNSVMWDVRSEGGGFEWAAVYFVSFVILGSFVILNLFIALVMEAFTNSLGRDDFKVNEDHYEQYTQAWSRYDPDGQWEIHPRDLKRLVKEVEPPLGVGANASVRDVVLFIETLQLQVNGKGNLEFRSVLFALAKAAYAEAVEKEESSDRPFDGPQNRGRKSALSEMLAEGGRHGLLMRNSGLRELIVDASPTSADKGQPEPSEQEIRYHLACGTLQDAARLIISHAKGMTNDSGQPVWPSEDDRGDDE